jgi:hypothetical protein
MIQDEE